MAEDIDKIFVGGEGQELVYPNIYLLAKDGSVKGIDVKEGYEEGTFTAYDISGLKNVESIDQVSVAKPNDSGYEAIVASTKDNEYYELRYELFLVIISNNSSGDSFIPRENHSLIIPKSPYPINAFAYASILFVDLSISIACKIVSKTIPDRFSLYRIK